MKYFIRLLKILLIAAILTAFIELYLIKALSRDPLKPAYQSTEEPHKSADQKYPMVEDSFDSDSQEEEPQYNNENYTPESEYELNLEELEYEADLSQGDTVNSTPKNEKVYFMTFEEVIAIEKISLRDKFMALGIFSKLQKDDIDRLLSLANGGITMDERQEMLYILEERLSSCDVNKLMNILDKNRKLRD